MSEQRNAGGRPISKFHLHEVLLYHGGVGNGFLESLFESLHH